ncbi:MAG: DUF4012 domain-containing protein [Candidatus Komeilibacteria bacterium]|nr:DUF4012 domain-containing protein [Candidatus Komeilibacteria bacterium]
MPIKFSRKTSVNGYIKALWILGALLIIVLVVQSAGLPKKYGSLFLEQVFKQPLKIAATYAQLVDSFDENLTVIKWLGGFDKERVYLVFFQNTAELRPTGGFWGSYGLLKVKDGAITSLVIDDIYHLDDKTVKALPQKPPQPLAEHLQVKQWFMRDLNWSPDFAQTARLALAFYRYLDPRGSVIQESPQSQPLQVDGVIAVNPSFISELLKKYGSLEIDNQLYEADNFLAKTQFQTSIGFREKRVSDWERKEFLQELADKLIAKIAATSGGFSLDDWKDWQHFWLMNTAQKNLLLYSAEPSIQSFLVAKNWAGALRQNPTGDYLMVADANLASLKTDPEIERKIVHQVEVGDIGHLVTTQITYVHHGQFDWRTTRYRTYVRVYVPLGVELKSATVKKANQDVVVTDSIKVSQELNKTVFGYFLSTEPQSEQTLILTYVLPQMGPDNYSLLVQKQPGAGRQTISLEYQGPQAVSQNNWPGQYHLNQNKFIGDPVDFVQDLEFNLNLADR